MQRCSAWGSTIMIQLNSKQDLQIKIVELDRTGQNNIFFLITLLRTYFEDAGFTCTKYINNQYKQRCVETNKIFLFSLVVL